MRVAALVVCLPLAFFAIRLLAHGWVLQGDEALVAVRAHDVWSAHPPLVGMRSTSSVTSPGVYAHHPGPLQFYLLAIPYAATNFASWSIVVTDAALACFFAALTVRAAFRAARWNGLWIAVAVLLLVERSFGDALVLPLNTWPAVLALTASLMLAWRLAIGQVSALPWYVAVASFAGQAHVIAFSVLVVLSAVLALMGGVRWWDRRASLWPIAGGGWVATSWWRRRGWVATGLLLLLWSPPLVDVLVDHPNNLTELVDTVSGRSSGTMLGLGSSMQYVASLIVPTGGEFDTIRQRPGDAAREAMALVAVGMLCWLILRGRSSVRRGRGPDRAVTGAALIGLTGTAAMAWIGSHAVLDLQLLYLDFVAPVAFFAGCVAVWGLSGVVLRHLPIQPPRWRGLAGGFTAALVLIATLWVPVLPGVHYSTRAGAGDRRLARRAVGAATRLVQSDRGSARQPIVVNGYGITSYGSLAPAISSALIARHRTVYFDVLWPRPQDDEFRRSKNAPTSATKLIIRERAGAAAWSLPTLPGTAVASTTLRPERGTGATVQLVLVR